jgi:hypothetical protein
VARINHAPAGGFNKVLADFLIVGQCSEPNTFARVVLGGHCETKHSSSADIENHFSSATMLGALR